MSSAWGSSWGVAWGSSWGAVGTVVTPPVNVGSTSQTLHYSKYLRKAVREEVTGGAMLVVFSVGSTKHPQAAKGYARVEARGAGYGVLTSPLQGGARLAITAHGVLEQELAEDAALLEVLSLVVFDV